MTQTPRPPGAYFFLTSLARRGGQPPRDYAPPGTKVRRPTTLRLSAVARTAVKLACGHLGSAGEERKKSRRRSPHLIACKTFMCRRILAAAERAIRSALSLSLLLGSRRFYNRASRIYYWATRARGDSKGGCCGLSGRSRLC